MPTEFSEPNPIQEPSGQPKQTKHPRSNQAKPDRMALLSLVKSEIGGEKVSAQHKSIGTPAAPEPERVAVFAVHGIGEQVRFETIDAAVQMLDRGLTRRGWKIAQIAARTVKLCGEDRARTELTVKHASNPNLNPFEIHVYEGYWSPLTEGRASLKDTMDFLWAAGFSGVHAAFLDYRRFLFQKQQRFGGDLPTFIILSFLLLFVGSLVVINGALAALAAKTAFFTVGARPKIPGETGGVIAALCLPTILGILTFLLAQWAPLHRLKAKHPPAPARPTSVPKPSWLWLPMIATALGMMVAAGIIAAIFMGWHFWKEDSLPTWVEPLRWICGWPIWALSLMLSLFVALSSVVRRALVDYVGDLAVYLCGHKSSKFFGDRQKIQEAVCNPLKAVYAAGVDGEARTAAGAAPLYDRVVVLAHSLGAVVAYDALNSAIKDDTLNANLYDVVARTKLFLTYGAPLDKTAYLFRSQLTYAPIREGLAASVQPMIDDYAYRPNHWVNVWSPNDPISGSLSFYDDATSASPKKILNLADPLATIPLVAHGQYFNNVLLPDELVEGVL